jgi:type IV pilus assembly protein PilC
MAAENLKKKEFQYRWEGKDKSGKLVKGEVRAVGDAVAAKQLRRQGINVTSIKKTRNGGGKKITQKDLTLFTRQLAVMMKSGVPLLQSFDIVGKGHHNPSVARLLNDIKTDVETGSSLEQAFRKFPLYFDDLFCNLIGAGEHAGILDSLLDRLATYQEKTLAIKNKIKGALMYPVSIIAIAFIITSVIMIFVIPAFKQLFSSFGADLPAPTLIMMSISDFFVTYWWAIFSILGGGLYAFFYFWKRSKKNAGCYRQNHAQTTSFRKCNP